MTPWEPLIPPISGVLPGGTPLSRTDPGGTCPADVAFLGVYPALTKQCRLGVDGTSMNLPVEVERTSFAPGSKSGAEIDDNYLQPLGLDRPDVFIFDLVPYFLANTTPSASGRSMADNVRLYERFHGVQTGIQTRPRDENFLAFVRDMPGNLDRLRDYLGRCRPRLLFTLGALPAAFVRGLTYESAARQADDLLYGRPERVNVLGVETLVAHLVHPHHFIKRTLKWTRRHEAWCRDEGRALVDAVRAGEIPAGADR